MKILHKLCNFYFYTDIFGHVLHDYPLYFRIIFVPFGKQCTTGSNARTRWRTKESFKLIPLLLQYNQQVDSISKWRTGSSSPSCPVERQAQHKELTHFFFGAEKAYKPSNTALHKELPTWKLLQCRNSYGGVERTAEWLQNHQNINTEKKPNGFQKMLDSGMAWKRYKKGTGLLHLQRY